MKKTTVFWILLLSAFLLPHLSINAEGSCPDGQQLLNETDGCVPISTAETTTQNTTQNGQTSGFVALAPIPGLTQGVTANEAGLANFFNNLYKYLIGMAAVLAVIMIIWGGLEYSTQDSPGSKSNGKDRILQAIFGLVLVLSPVLVFSIINPSILNLSINLKKLDTASSFPTGTGSGGGTPTTDPATGCVVSGISGLLQVATCPSSAAFGAWSQTCIDSGSHLSTGPQRYANGVLVSGIIICDSRPTVTFIDLSTSVFNLASSFNRLQPLAGGGGSVALQFASACLGANIGRKVCISDTPLITFATACPSGTPIPPPTANGKCYRETLSCEDVIGSNNKCSNSPSWSLF